MASSFAIAEVKALVRQPQRDHAQQLLERLATAVLPILTQRRFRVRRLLEFFPKNGSLLGMNVNRGAKIYVRLRPKGNPNVFLPYEALLETLLHELTHMVHGPHNQAFYKYLDELKAEMEALMVRGLTGEEGVKFGGAGEGHRLGGQSSGVPIRFAAVLAAKRREQYNRLLGAATSNEASSVVLDPQALRRKILEAAERRRRDNENCRNVLREGSSHEVLGIESSDDDGDDRHFTTTFNGVAGQQPASEATVIVLDDTEEPAVRRQAVNQSPGCDASTIIELLDDETEVKDNETESINQTISSADRASHGHRDYVVKRDRKRPRQADASKIIDLT